jgi:hypothetical protein
MAKDLLHLENLPRTGVATTELDNLMGLDIELDSSDAEKDEMMKQAACYILNPREDHVTQKAQEIIESG